MRISNISLSTAYTNTSFELLTAAILRFQTHVLTSKASEELARAKSRTTKIEEYKKSMNRLFLYVQKRKSKHEIKVVILTGINWEFGFIRFRCPSKRSDRRTC